MYKHLTWTATAIILALLAVGCGGGGGGGSDPITLTITSPTNGATVNQGSLVAIAASVSASAGVARVEFYVDDTYKYTDSAGPTYEYSWNTAGYAPGSYIIKVTAYDLAVPPNLLSKTVTVNVTIAGFAVYAQGGTVSQSGTISVPIHLVNPTATPAGYQMTVKYDPVKLELVSGAASVQPGTAVPAAPNRIIAKNTATAGKITIAVVGWNNSTKQIVDLITTNTQLLTIQFRAIGTAGATTIDIDETAGATTPLQLWKRDATKITPGPAAVDGVVTIQ